MLESKANFLFVTHNRIHAKIIFNELKNSGILVRYFDKPRIHNFLRISIGTDEEMDILINKLRNIVWKSHLQCAHIKKLIVFKYLRINTKLKKYKKMGSLKRSAITGFYWGRIICLGMFENFNSCKK